MKKKEITVVIILCVLAIFSYFAISFFNDKKTKVSVKNAYGEILLTFNLDEDNYYELNGDYGTFHIEVKDNKCRAIDVECPNHICESVGWISASNPLPIVCLPNNIIIMIDE